MCSYIIKPTEPLSNAYPHLQAGVVMSTIRMTAFFNCEPLEMEYLYTVLKDMAEIRLLDGQVKKHNLGREIKEWQPQLLLITSIITNINQALKIAQQVKQLESPPLIFVGGPHAEVLPQHYFSNDIDAVCAGRLPEGLCICR